MNIHTYYDSDGRVTCVYAGSIPERMDDLYPGQSRIGCGVDGKTHFISAGIPTPRPPSPVVRDGLRLSAIPAGATLHIDGVAYSIPEGGSVELDFPLPGTYLIRVECFPFLDFTDSVTI